MGERTQIDFFWSISAGFEHRPEQCADRAVAQVSNAQILFFGKIDQHHQFGRVDRMRCCTSRTEAVARKPGIAGDCALQRFEIRRPVGANWLCRFRGRRGGSLPDGLLCLRRRRCRFIEPIGCCFFAQIIDAGIAPPAVYRICEGFCPVLRCDLHVSQQSPVDAQVNCLAWRILSVER